MGYGLVQWALGPSQKFHGYFSHHVQGSERCHLQHPFCVIVGLLTLHCKQQKWRHEFHKLVQMGLLKSLESRSPY